MKNILIETQNFGGSGIKDILDTLSEYDNENLDEIMDRFYESLISNKKFLLNPRNVDISKKILEIFYNFGYSSKMSFGYYVEPVIENDELETDRDKEIKKLHDIKYAVLKHLFIKQREWGGERFLEDRYFEDKRLKPHEREKLIELYSTSDLEFYDKDNVFINELNIHSYDETIERINKLLENNSLPKAIIDVFETLKISINFKLAINNAHMKCLALQKIQAIELFHLSMALHDLIYDVKNYRATNPLFHYTTKELMQKTISELVLLNEEAEKL